MSSIGLGSGWSHAPDSLDPPATEEERTWWDSTMAAKHRKRIIATMALAQLPIALGGAYLRGWAFVFSLGGLDMLAHWAFVSGVGGYLSWKVARGPRFNHEIIGRRLRQAIATPDESMGELPSTGATTNR